MRYLHEDGGEKDVAIKLNNAASNDPCAICGARTDLESGPELFLDGTNALVCYECGEKYAPELVKALQAYRSGRVTTVKNVTIHSL